MGQKTGSSDCKHLNQKMKQVQVQNLQLLNDMLHPDFLAVGMQNGKGHRHKSSEPSFCRPRPRGSCSHCGTSGWRWKRAMAHVALVCTRSGELKWRLLIRDIEGGATCAVAHDRRRAVVVVFGNDCAFPALALASTALSRFRRTQSAIVLSVYQPPYKGSGDVNLHLPPYSITSSCAI